MSFNKGDTVRRLGPYSQCGVHPGDVCVVHSYEDDVLLLEGHTAEFDQALFALVKRAETAPTPPTSGVTKATNPKQAFGDAKAQLGLVPDTLAYYAGLAFFEGATKYGAYNWRVAGVRASTYKAAAERHLKKWFNGEAVDPKTKVPHLASAIACLAIILDAERVGKLTDDRPPAADLASLEEEVAAVQAHLRELHKDFSPQHWTQEAVVAA